MTQQERDALVGEFIEIPAWQVTGCVLDTKAAMLGSDDSISVLVQESPDDETGRWYRLEPNEYEVV